jgi:hypothetical protein
MESSKRRLYVPLSNLTLQPTAPIVAAAELGRYAAARAGECEFTGPMV